MKFVLTAVKMSTLVFWVVTECGFVGRYHRFARTCYLHLQGSLHTAALKIVTARFSEKVYLPSRPHGVETQTTKNKNKNIIFQIRV
jgi:hypothetical protein